MTNITKRSLLMLATAITVTTILEFYTRNKTQSDWLIDTMGWAAWGIAPYLILLGLIRMSDKNNTQAVVAFVGSLIVVIFGLGSFFDGFFVHPDAQSALLFIFLPLWQLMGSIILALIIFAVHAIWCEG